MEKPNYYLTNIVLSGIVVITEAYSSIVAAQDSNITLGLLSSATASLLTINIFKETGKLIDSYKQNKLEKALEA